MSTTSLTRRFFVRDIETDCSIGIHDFERAAKQRILVNVEVVLDSDLEPQSDNVKDALDYDMIRDSVLEIINSRHFDLQETLARTIFDKMMSLPSVTQVCIRTAKPDFYPDCSEVAYQLSNVTS